MEIENLPEIDVMNPENFDRLPDIIDWSRYPDGLARSPRGLEVLSYGLVGEAYRSAALRNSTGAKMNAIGFSEGPVHDALTGMTTSTEGPEHRQMRRAFQPWFLQGNVERFREEIRAAVGKRLERNSSDVVNFADELGAELPSLVFTQLVGGDASEAPLISRLSSMILQFPSYDPAVHDEVERATLEALDWISSLIERKLGTREAM